MLRYFLIVLNFLALCCLGVRGQEKINLSLVIRPLNIRQFPYEIFDDFESAHPNVEIQIVEYDPSGAFAHPAYFGADGYFDGTGGDAGIANYANMADVLFVTDWGLQLEATRAGYFLDLAPLVQADPNLDISDFYQAVWQSFQWESGIWAIPNTAMPSMWIYDANAFDNAGIAYPTENWTLDDFERVAQTLAQKNADGSVQIPAFFSFEMSKFARALVNQPLYSINGLELSPDLVNPETEAFLHTWQQLASDNYVTLIPTNFDGNNVPLQVNMAAKLADFGQDNTPYRWQSALLPSGTTELSVEGYAVSAGTQYPELAYELAMYLSSNPQLVTYTWGNMPARRSLIPELEEQDYFRAFGIQELYPQLEEYLEVAIPSTELFFSVYIENALWRVQNGEDPADALLAEQQAAENNLAIADARRETNNVAVEEPNATEVPSNGEIVLNVGAESYFGNSIDTESWQQFNEDFAANNSSVASVNLAAMSNLGEATTDYDCFFTPFNAASIFAQDTILNQAPLMAVDADFNPNNFLPNVLAQASTDDGGIWAYPLALYPDLLWINSAVADELRLEADFNWSVEDFAIAQAAFQEQHPNEVFLASDIQDDTYLLMLMASYGGLLFDYSSHPSGIAFSAESSVAAAQQVLDLARSGSIAYQSDNAIPFIYAASTLSSAVYEANGYVPLNYPRNADYTPVSYSLGMGYISAQSQNPQACYDWFKALAQHPDLLYGMPVQSEILANSANLLGVNKADFYQAYADVLQSGNTAFFAGRFANVSWQGDFVEHIWLDKVFDAYVLEADNNLAANLAAAEAYIGDFRTCLAADSTINECARAVDPSLASDSRIGS